MELALPKLSQPLKLWEQIELVTGEGNQAGYYKARIEDFIDEGIVISNPEFVKGKTLLRENSDVFVLITRVDAVYRCYSTIKKCRHHNSNLFILSPPQHIRRIQRRQFVRVDIWAPIEYAMIVLSTDQENYEENLTWHKTTTLDISGGGVLLKLTDSFNVNDKLLLKIGLFLEMGFPSIIAGICRRIVTVDKQKVAGIELFTSDVLLEYFSFEELKYLPQAIKDFDKQIQNKLVNFIFNKQIELRQKGILNK